MYSEEAVAKDAAYRQHQGTLLGAGIAPEQEPHGNVAERLRGILFEIGSMANQIDLRINGPRPVPAVNGNQTDRHPESLASILRDADASAQRAYETLRHILGSL